MRARLAIFYATIDYEHREIVLRDKPDHMLEISPKSTVPVLLLPDGTVIDESLDIMKWSLTQNDPENWLGTGSQTDEIFTLIERNDTTFKHYLDRYKYPNRYPEEETTGIAARDMNIKILTDLDQRIAQNGFLCGNTQTLADMAIFPFIRQFAHVDRDWFYNLPNENLKNWLTANLESSSFNSIMKKHDLWTI